MENDNYVNKWLQGSLTEEEKRNFETSEEFKSLDKLSKALKSFQAPEYNTGLEYDRLRTAISPKGKVIALNWVNPMLKIAAVLAVIAGSYFLFLRDRATVVKTLAAEKTQVNLPDKSLVLLNAFSQISFAERNWKERRQVNLDGEAFFKVAKGSRFDVITSSGKISVLGTQFNVRNRNEYFEVICYEGSVEVQRGNDVVNLLPRQMFRMISGVKDKEKRITKNAPDWIAGESSFQSVPFLYVIQEFERQYNVSITTRNVNTDQLFSGTFIHADRSLALKSITIPLNLSYQLEEDKKIVLTGDIQ